LLELAKEVVVPRRDVKTLDPSISNLLMEVFGSGSDLFFLEHLVGECFLLSFLLVFLFMIQMDFPLFVIIFFFAILALELKSKEIFFPLTILLKF